MARQKTKKDKNNPSNKVIYEELPSLQAETPEEMLTKLGGVAGRATQEHLGGSKPFTSTGGQGQLPGLEPSGFDLKGSQLAPEELGAHQQESTDLGRSDYHMPPPNWEQIGTQVEQAGLESAKEGHWNQAANDYEQAARDFASAGGTQAQLMQERTAYEKAGAAFDQAGAKDATQDHHNEAAAAYENAAQAYSAAINNTGDTSDKAFSNIAMADNNAADQFAFHHANEAATAYEDAAINFNQAGHHNAADAAQQMANGERDAAAGHHNEAGTAYENAAQDYSAAGHPNQANEAWGKAAQNYNTVAQNDAGTQNYLGSGAAYENAARAFTNAGDTDSEKTAYTNAGQNYLLAAEHDSGASHYNQAAAAYENAAQAFTNAGDTSSEKSAYNNAGHNYLLAAETAICLPDGTIDVNSKHFNQAMAAYESAAKAFANAGNTSDERRAYEFITVDYELKASEDYGNGHYNRAADAYMNLTSIYNQVIQNGDHSPRVYDNLAKAYLGEAHALVAAGDRGGAGACFVLAGSALGQAGNYLEAAKTFEQAASTYSAGGELNTAGSAYQEAAEMYVKLGPGHLVDAITDYNHAITIFTQLDFMGSVGNIQLKLAKLYEQTDGPIMGALALHDAGAAFKQAGEYLEAATAFEQAACLDSAVSGATWVAGTNYRDAGQMYAEAGLSYFQDAVNSYNQSIAAFTSIGSDRQCAVTYTDLGLAYTLSATNPNSQETNSYNDLSSAWTAYQNAAKANPADASTIWSMAETEFWKACQQFQTGGTLEALATYYAYGAEHGGNTQGVPPPLSPPD